MHTYLHIQQSYSKYFLINITLKLSLQDGQIIKLWKYKMMHEDPRLLESVHAHASTYVHKHTHTKYYINSGWEDCQVFYSLQWLKQTEVGK